MSTHSNLPCRASQSRPSGWSKTSSTTTDTPGEACSAMIFVVVDDPAADERELRLPVETFEVAEDR